MQWENQCMQKNMCLHSTCLLTPTHTPCSARWPNARCQKLWKEKTYALLYILSAGKLTSKTHINLAKSKTLRPPVTRFITRILMTLLSKIACISTWYGTQIQFKARSPETSPWQHFKHFKTHLFCTNVTNDMPRVATNHEEKFGLRLRSA